MRKIASLSLLIAGFIELITSVVLYIIPSGRVAYWSNYKLLGLSKTQWGDIHITVGTLLLLMALAHIYFNWRPLTAYLKNKARQLTIFNRNFNIALLLSLYFTIGTLYHLPPMNLILQFGEYITEQGNDKYGEPPYGHAELSSLKMFCSKMNLDLAKATELLAQANITISGPQQAMGEIAAANQLTPQQIFELIKPAGQALATATGSQPFPDAPSPSFGKQSLATICASYGLDREQVRLRLQEQGMTFSFEDTVKEVASANNSQPMAIFELLHDIARTQ